MRRSTWLFIAAIVLPSLVLAWLAVRSARDQQVLLEHQEAMISQGITDDLARRVQEQLDAVRADFIETVGKLLQKTPSPYVLASDFDPSLRRLWKMADIGFAVGVEGRIYSPQPDAGTAAKTFRVENDRFLSNQENAPVFSQRIAAPRIVTAEQQSQMSQVSQAPRLVIPQQNATALSNLFSNAVAAESDFRRIVGVQASGSLARFLENKLRLLVWHRPPGGGLVFGAQINPQQLIRNLEPLLRGANEAYCLAILDDRGKPAALSRAGFQADWKHPSAATEIGEGLPHWEAALYPVDPKRISRSASTLQLTLALVVVALVGMIFMGGWLVSADARRQMRLAQLKTDFVSNVSHELKTPLTSIRMFADMLADGRVTEQARQAKYLRIISAESARLTRLINNVLDFARMERGAPEPEAAACDLVQVVREIVQTSRPHLETVGVAMTVEEQIDRLPLIGNRDALGQIVLNLLSNAEKYGNGEILVVVREASGSGCVDVLDRGPGIPEKQREAIFQPFHRLNDSLSNGTSGSGLGLTLARRMAKAHGGDVTHKPREGGGSCFTLSVPLRGVGTGAGTKDENQDTGH